MASRLSSAHGVDWLCAFSAAAFIVVLAIAAYWDPTIRVLHAFEALPYAVAGVLCLQQRKVGYLIGIASGGVWLWIAATRTSFVRNGVERVVMLIRTGHVDRWDQFIAAPAALATGGLALWSLWGYARVRPKSAVDAVALVALVAAVFGFFIVIFWSFAPVYLGLFGHLFQR